MAGLDLRQIERVTQYRREILAGAVASLEEVAHTALWEIGDREVRQADDGVQGRSDLVAHSGQELALGPVRLLRAIARHLKRVLGALPLGQVGDEANEGRRRTTAVDLSQGHLRGKLASVRASSCLPDTLADDVGPAGVEVARDGEEMGFAEPLRHDRVCECPADEFFPRVAKRLEGRLVRHGDPVLMIHQHHRVGGGLDHGSIAGLGVFELLESLLALLQGCVDTLGLDRSSVGLTIQEARPRRMQHGRETQRKASRESGVEPVAVLYEECDRGGPADEREADEGQEPSGGSDEVAGADDEEKKVD